MRDSHGILAICFSLAAVLGGVAALAQPAAGPQTGFVFRNTVTGEQLDVAEGKAGGRDTPAVKQFFQTGKNSYIDDKSCLRNGESLFATSCSGCHGHLAEGKLGPGLNDNYWTYPSNTEDTGLFATIFGGANGMMGPHNENLTPDEMLQVIAWIRHLYTGPVQDAVWLNDAQKKNYTPYKQGETFPKDVKGQCPPLED
ncbi:MULTISPECIES: cytochrome c(L), periplasmic [unclassified Methylobacterium]|jgi:cytochrome c-L|uniref:cytochrome c(L), periplasmic n=1 Tax=unclassified Methylobacterium TaxID=2615210 RepID=UPI0007018D1B|nr:MULTISPECIES: cytochrome c(L), periplasmic [unclassified Methylobacterium]KQO73557.1 cytochrome C biogenesis protein CcdA [Methylobacterium sp. Leaf89]KQO78710.1 cytochrome C biogenesis protein CcdA [Methylobacterium sp. Leaf88]KQP69774.1 cytochrome C biogenesis protein CcdA [Methylobacterium sp. Leaf111]KQT83301.1 cytochrome C biogenesis protein CcdA [Methylobacterium sp. Leaf465]KQU22549.1 cytochrome C biogenesis protein CcdA [Methylobacterium sp. Leaf94]